MFWSPAELQSSLTHKHAALSHSLFGLPFTTPNSTWLICAANLCYLPFNVLLSLQWFSPQSSLRLFPLDLGLLLSCHPPRNIIRHYSAGHSQDCHQYLPLTCLYSLRNPIYHLFNNQPVLPLNLSRTIIAIQPSLWFYNICTFYS